MMRATAEMLIDSPWTQSIDSYPSLRNASKIALPTRDALREMHKIDGMCFDPDLAFWQAWWRIVF